MLISEFVSAVLQEFESLPKPLSQSESKDLYKLFAYKKPIDPNMIERASYPAELVNFLNSYKSSTLKATHENLTPFINILSKRWKNIKDFPTERYEMAPNDISNRAHMIVAKHLAQALNGNSYDYLMPVVKISDNRSECNFTEFKFI
jgi:ABC-type metal ion transport system substrate-binding protein